MVSAKLVHQVEDHWEAISARLLRLLRTTQGLPHFHTVSESEVREMCQRILHNLGHWLVSSSEEEIAIFYERVGRQRHKEGVPLSEAIRGVQLMREACIDYVRDQSSVQTGFDLYAEEELECRLTRFFDLLIFHLARGFEQSQNLQAP
jgi:hypothetical protein